MRKPLQVYKVAFLVRANGVPSLTVSDFPNNATATKAIETVESYDRKLNNDNVLMKLRAFKLY